MTDLLYRLREHPRLLALVVVGLAGLVAALAVAVWPDGLAPGEAHADAVADGPARADHDGDGVVYQGELHPWVVQDAPGSCPVCGKALRPVRVGGPSRHSVRVDAATLRAVDVRTARVAVEPLPLTVRLTGRFEVDERLTRRVASRVDGRVAHLHVTEEGERVRAGQPLVELAGAELVATQDEYLLALRHRERVAGTPAEAAAERLVAAARRRLAHWHLSTAQVERLERTGQPQRTVTLYAPAAGTVTAVDAARGDRVAAGRAVVTLAGLERLWLLVDLERRALPWVEPGTAAFVGVPYDPGRTVRSTVDAVADHPDEPARLARARLLVDNPEGRIRPGMPAAVRLVGVRTEPYPVVPSDALVRRAGADVVVLAEGDAHFRPVVVQTGLEADGRTQILDGLDGGERVVVGAALLVDAEARLASAVAALTRPTADAEAP